MWSSFYGWRISHQTMLESSLHHISFSFRSRSGGLFGLVGSWTGDMAIIPAINVVHPQLRFAAGLSMRMQIVGYSTSSTSGVQFQYYREYIDQQHTVALGGTCKVEYVLPGLSEQTNVVLRAQGHIYLSPFIGEAAHTRATPADAIVSIGASLRLNW